MSIPTEQVAQLERMVGGDALRLEIRWLRKGKPIDGETQVFAVGPRGRVACPYCGSAFGISVFREHYFGCRAKVGEW
jgi:hypothetical protein